MEVRTFVLFLESSIHLIVFQTYGLIYQKITFGFHTLNIPEGSSIKTQI